MARTLALVLVIFLALWSVTEGRRIVEGQQPAMDKPHVVQLDSRRLSHQLLAHYQRVQHLPSPDRRSPGGPDPEHH
ncbi:hypothetical protein GBA52_010406 [Prunus armeniaca]|nr:hypothetical protein GBA52_010334 [Prunus armeniaca]KAH0983229.1 hypothetical protein GBA52_010406 [Prunus armeniaca]